MSNAKQRARVSANHMQGNTKTGVQAHGNAGLFELSSDGANIDVAKSLFFFSRWLTRVCGHAGGTARANVSERTFRRRIPPALAVGCRSVNEPLCTLQHFRATALLRISAHTARAWRGSHVPKHAFWRCTVWHIANKCT